VEVSADIGGLLGAYGRLKGNAHCGLRQAPDGATARSTVAMFEHRRGERSLGATLDVIE
jgi:hypothetical protein